MIIAYKIGMVENRNASSNDIMSHDHAGVQREEMKSENKQPVAPQGRGSTIRQMIAKAIEGNALSALDISGEVKIPEKEVYDHLEHIQRSVNQSKIHDFVVIPSECNACGFIFKKRDRLKKPTKCPVCRNQSITAPIFSIKKHKSNQKSS